MIIAETGKLIKEYFQNKTQQLIAISNQGVCEHNGLKGSHREELIKIYLSDIIPKRFEIGHGMIYGNFTRSNETDIVLWDAFNFPKLNMYGHAMYFAESVNAAIEVKTNYNSESEQNVSEKSKIIKSIIRHPRETIDSRLYNIERSIESIKYEGNYEGCLSAAELITTCAIYINGGGNFDIKNFNKYDDIYTEWPDITLFLKAGKLAIKLYDYEKNVNFIRLYNSGMDSLLLFTKYLLELLSEQVVLVEGGLYFDHYILAEIEDISYEDFEYQSYRPYSGFKQAIFSNKE